MQKYYKCVTCNKAFSDEIQLNMHKEKIHPQPSKELKDTTMTAHTKNKDYECTVVSITHTTEKDYDCLDCKQVFSNENQLNVHKEQVHSALSKDSNDAPKPNHTAEKNYKFRKVPIIHTAQKYYECIECKEAFCDENQLKVHMKQIHPKLYKVSKKSPIIIHTAENNYKFKEVPITHTAEQCYECIKCKETFSDENQLNVHMKQIHQISQVKKDSPVIIHMKNKNYKCADCKKSFYDESQLNVHRELHCGANPYKCSHCDETFYEESNLKTHILSHSGKITLKCTRCQALFLTFNQLEAHIKNTHPYKCSECNAIFDTEICLIYHVRVHEKKNLEPYRKVRSVDIPYLKM